MRINPDTKDSCKLNMYNQSELYQCLTGDAVDFSINIKRAISNFTNDQLSICHEKFSDPSKATDLEVCLIAND